MRVAARGFAPGSFARGQHGQVGRPPETATLRTNRCEQTERRSSKSEINARGPQVCITWGREGRRCAEAPRGAWPDAVGEVWHEVAKPLQTQNPS